jgi:hypothetical protein
MSPPLSQPISIPFREFTLAVPETAAKELTFLEANRISSADKTPYDVTAELEKCPTSESAQLVKELYYYQNWLRLGELGVIAQEVVMLDCLDEASRWSRKKLVIDAAKNDRAAEWMSPIAQRYINDKKNDAANVEKQIDIETKFIHSMRDTVRRPDL